MSDELTQKQEQSSNNKNEQQSNSHESQANYAFAQMRKENSELNKRVDELKTANEELKKKINSFENNKSKETFKAEFKKQGGKDEAFDAFCELNKDLLKEADETKSKVLFELAKQKYSFMFDKVINNNLAASIGNDKSVKLNNVDNNKKTYWYVDKDGVTRRKQ